MSLPEPRWERLPFTTSSQLWIAYVETATAGEALAFLEGTPATQPSVWLERAALTTFAGVAQVSIGEAFVLLGQGVLRWWQPSPPLQDGQCMGDVRFRGAPDLQLSVGYLDGCLLVHFPVRLPLS